MGIFYAECHLKASWLLGGVNLKFSSQARGKRHPPLNDQV